MPTVPSVAIAVVDDDDSFRAALVDSLSSLGYSARGYNSAEKFVEEDRAASYDCVITDIHMPGMSGLDLKRSLSDRGSKVPVIMISGRVDSELEVRATSSGAICLLGKPFDSATLVNYLERAVNSSRTLSTSL